jgi:tetratricopeptide (TPR) repeat protein
MISRRDYRYTFYQRRRAQRVRFLLLLAVAAVAAFVVIMTNLSTARQVAAGALGFKPASTLYPAQHAMLGAEAFQAGNMAAAAAEFAQAVEMQPDNVAYLYEYGKVLIEVGDSTGASKVADRAIAADPRDVRGYALKANALAHSDPTNALIFALQGQEIDRNFSPVYSAMAVANTNIYRYTQALMAGETAIELDPADPNAYRAYSFPLVGVGQFEAVIEQLEMATSLNPNLPNPWFELAAYYKHPLVNNPRRALAIYEYMAQNLTMSVDDTAKLYLRICETYAAADQADFVAATNNCERALTIRPDYGAVYGQLGQMQYVRRNYESAIQTFQTCLDYDAEDLRCYTYKGLAHWFMSECDDAWQLLNHAKVLGAEQGVPTEGGIMEQIDDGIFNVIAKCPNYRSVAAPTTVPPTQIPPTPIVGL